MNGKASRPPDSEVSDFADILFPQEGSDPPVVVGGHAVNIWALYFLSKGVNGLAEYLPFTSKDLDLIGTLDFLRRLERRFKGELTRSPPRSPVLGRLDIPRADGRVLRIEVLHTVQGLGPGELSRTTDLRVGGMQARVLHPHLILKAKISNSVGIDQAGRSDVKHVRMMVLCVRRVVEELIEDVAAGRIPERTAVNLLGEIREIVDSPEAEKATAKWRIDFTEVWPMDALRSCGAEKIARFVKHRFGE